MYPSDIAGKTRSPYVLVYLQSCEEGIPEWKEAFDSACLVGFTQTLYRDPAQLFDRVFWAALADRRYNPTVSFAFYDAAHAIRDYLARGVLNQPIILGDHEFPGHTFD